MDSEFYIFAAAMTLIAFALLLYWFLSGWFKSEPNPRIAMNRVKLNWFQGYMAEKLIDNMYKKHWSSLSVYACMNRLNDEIRELEEAIDSNMDKESVCRECADVANFAMFVADNYEQDMRSKLDGKDTRPNSK